MTDSLALRVVRTLVLLSAAIMTAGWSGTPILGKAKACVTCSWYYFGGQCYASYCIHGENTYNGCTATGCVCVVAGQCSGY